MKKKEYQSPTAAEYMASPSVSFAMLINCTQEQPLKKLAAISSRGGGFY